MQLIAERGQELTHATAGVIEIAEGEEMAYKVTCGEATPFLELEVAIDSSLSGLCVSARARCCAATTPAVDPRVDAEGLPQVNAISMICVPLVHRGARSARSRSTRPRPSTSTTATSRRWSCSAA